jgi:hypothetical protein
MMEGEYSFEMDMAAEMPAPESAVTDLPTTDIAMDVGALDIAPLNDGAAMPFDTIEPLDAGDWGAPLDATTSLDANDLSAPLDATTSLDANDLSAPLDTTTSLDANDLSAPLDATTSLDATPSLDTNDLSAPLDATSSLDANDWSAPLDATSSLDANDWSAPLDATTSLDANDWSAPLDATTLLDANDLSAPLDTTTSLDTNDLSEPQWGEPGREPSEPQVGEPGREPSEPQVGEPGREPSEPQVGEPGREPSEPQWGEPGREPSEPQWGEPGREPSEPQWGEPGREPSEPQWGEPGREPSEPQVGEPGREPSEPQVGEPGREPSEPQWGEPTHESEELQTEIVMENVERQPEETFSPSSIEKEPDTERTGGEQSGVSLNDRDPLGTLAFGMVGLANEGSAEPSAALPSDSTDTDRDPLGVLATGLVGLANENSQGDLSAEIPPANQTEIEVDGQKYTLSLDGFSPPPDPSTYEYTKGSPHADFDLYMADKDGRAQAEINRAASTADSLPDALATTAAAINESQSGESEYDAQVREWFESQYGPAPYTEPAYPEIQPDEEPTSVTQDGLGDQSALQSTHDSIADSNLLEDSPEKSALDIDQLKSDAISAAVVRINEPSDSGSKSVRTSLYSDACGTLGEELCVRANGLNRLDETLKNNTPVFDASSDTELASVKAHIVGNEENAIGNYAHDLRSAMGLVDEDTFTKAATTLWDARADPEKWSYLQEHLPEKVCNAASIEELAEAMRESATLRVPADHVDKINEYLDRVAEKNPKLYGIDPETSPEEMQAKIDALKARVLPIAEGVTAHDMRVSARDVFRTKLLLLR